MGIDEALKAALGYMLPSGMELDKAVVDLYERVLAELGDVDDSIALIQWQGEIPLKHGYGELVVKVTRIVAWEEWTIARRDVGDSALWPIMQWEQYVTAAN